MKKSAPNNVSVPAEPEITGQRPTKRNLRDELTAEADTDEVRAALSLQGGGFTYAHCIVLDSHPTHPDPTVEGQQLKPFLNVTCTERALFNLLLTHSCSSQNFDWKNGQECPTSWLVW